MKENDLIKIVLAHLVSMAGLWYFISGLCLLFFCRDEVHIIRRKGQIWRDLFGIFQLYSKINDAIICPHHITMLYAAFQ